MKKPHLASFAFLVVAALSIFAAFAPAFRGGRMNVVFLGTAVVFFALAVVMARKARLRTEG